MKTSDDDSVLFWAIALSLAGVLVIYMLSLHPNPVRITAANIDSGMVGRVVSVNGNVTGVSLNPKGHVFLKLNQDGVAVTVALFSDFVRGLNKTGIGMKDFAKGKNVGVTGTLDIYDGQLRIVPRKVSDFNVS